MSGFTLLICQNCGKSFKAGYYSNAKYCSKECRAQARTLETNNCIKFGITERGDAAIDQSWTRKLNNYTIQAAILITKDPSNIEFIENVMKFKDRIIIHATVTGYGGTNIEPHVKPWEQSIEGINTLINNGFPKEQIVLRVDPIIPTKKGLNLALKVIQSIDIPRVRISFIDNYKHLSQRGLMLPWETFNPPQELIDNAMSELIKLGREIEVCGENIEQKDLCIGCISKKDFDILGLPYIEIDVKYKQRPSCNCHGSKVELLNSRKQCPHGCLYCYWRGS